MTVSFILSKTEVLLCSDTKFKHKIKPKHVPNNMKTYLSIQYVEKYSKGS